MTNEHETWEAVAEVAGEVQAEILKGLLEAQGIPVWLSQEGAGRAIGLSISSLGTVHIMVPSDALSSAQDVLDRYERGEFENKGADESLGMPYEGENEDESDEG